jgi:CysZ protein
LAATFVTKTLRGLYYPIEGLGFIRQHRLWGMAAIPTIVNILLFVIVVAVTLWLVVPWLTGLESTLQPASSEGIWASLLGVLAKVLTVVLWILVPLAILIIGAGIIVLVGQAVASPFLDLLSEKVETIVLGTEPAPATVARTVRSIVVACADVVWTLVFFLAVNIPLLLINFIPVLGAVLNAALSFGFAALLLSQEFVGLSLARQLVSYPARWRVVWANRWEGLGFGCTTMLLLLVPGLNLILLPLASVGGTLLYCDLKAANRVDAQNPQPPGD